MTPSAGQHLQDILDALTEAGGRFAGAPSLDERPDRLAFLEAMATFPGGVRLAVAILADVVGGQPAWLSYRFHLMDAANVTIFRYDNAPHHKGLASFPHHKHVGAGENAVDGQEPTLDSILDAVRDYISE